MGAVSGEAKVRLSGPHEVGTAALLSGRGGRAVAYATAPEAGQGRRATPSGDACLEAVRTGGANPPDRPRAA
jgi:hypothetical protein